MSSRSWGVVLAAVAAAVIVVALVWPRRHPPAAVSDAPAEPSVTLYTARTETFVERVRTQGRIGAPAGNEMHVSFAETGVVSAIFVHVGERVAKGEALAQLDDGALGLDAAQLRDVAAARLLAAEQRLASLERGDASPQSAATAARALLEQSQAKIVADEGALSREQQLYDAGIAARKDVDAARETLTLDRADATANRANARSAGSSVGVASVQAQADVAQANSDVRAAQRALANATLRAPGDGVVTMILKHVAETADPTQPAIVLVAPTASEAVTLTVDGGQAAEIRPGDPVVVAIPLRNLRRSGVVRVIVPSTDASTQTATVVATGAPSGGQAGDAVEATIALYGRARRGIVIPTEAIVVDPETGRTIVFVRRRTADGERFVARSIEVAAGDDRHSLVTRGLRNGDRIAAQGAYDLLAPAGGE